MADYTKWLESIGHSQLGEKFEEMGVKHSNALRKLLEDDPNLLKELGVEDPVERSKIKNLIETKVSAAFQKVIIFVLVFLFLGLGLVFFGIL
jgi:hypothetical protein